MTPAPPPSTSSVRFIGNFLDPLCPAERERWECATSSHVYLCAWIMKIHRLGIISGGGSHPASIQMIVSSFPIFPFFENGLCFVARFFFSNGRVLKRRLKMSLELAENKMLERIRREGWRDEGKIRVLIRSRRVLAGMEGWGPLSLPRVREDYPGRIIEFGYR